MRSSGVAAVNASCGLLGWPKSENSILGILGREWHTRRLCMLYDVDAELMYVTIELNENPDARSRQEWSRFRDLTQGRTMKLVALPQLSKTVIQLEQDGAVANTTATLRTGSRAWLTYMSCSVKGGADT